MSADILANPQLDAYDNDEIQLMDTDEANLNLEEELQLLQVPTDVAEQSEEKEETKKREEVPSLLVIEVCSICVNWNLIT